MNRTWWLPWWTAPETTDLLDAGELSDRGGQNRRGTEVADTWLVVLAAIASAVAVVAAAAVAAAAGVTGATVGVAAVVTLGSAVTPLAVAALALAVELTGWLRKEAAGMVLVATGRGPWRLSDPESRLDPAAACVRS